MRLPGERIVARAGERIHELADSSRFMADRRWALIIALGLGAFLLYTGVAGIGIAAFLSLIGFEPSMILVLASASALQQGAHLLAALAAFIYLFKNKR